MNKVQKRRLLNVARALRESKNPRKFTMARFNHPCGTPACALGHYAARTDLQKAFVVPPKERLAESGYSDFGLVCWRGAGEPRQRAVEWPSYDCIELARYFGLDGKHDDGKHDLDALFGTQGCDNARTAIQAAEYIEAFVARQG